jgi:menaquinone-9 beta-reductase
MIVTDVVVAGGEPVGLAAAIAIRQRGFRVVVADRARPPIDKPCGEGIMPEGVPALNDLGIACGSFGMPFRGIRFTEAGCSAEGLFGDRPGIGLRRTVLHRHLVDRGRAIGVVLHWGEPIRLLNPFGVELGGEKRCGDGLSVRMGENRPSGDGRVFAPHRRSRRG